MIVRLSSIVFSFKYDTSTTNILIIRTMTTHNPKLNLFNIENSQIYGNGWRIFHYRMAWRLHGYI